MQEQRLVRVVLQALQGAVDALHGLDDGRRVVGAGDEDVAVGAGEQPSLEKYVRSTRLPPSPCRTRRLLNVTSSTDVGTTNPMTMSPLIVAAVEIS